MKKKLLKIVSTSTLALIMGAGVLCGTIVPINSGGSAAATMTSQNAQSGQQAFHNTSGAATQENLVAREAIQLNPQTDETIFTTESGFEIKSHTVAGQTVANSKVQYFTLGSYNGTPLNWIILAGSTTMAENTTPAGKAINGDANNGKQTLSMMTDSKLSANQMLVISEKVIPLSTGTLNVTAYSGTKTQTVSQVNGSYQTVTYYANLLLDDAADYYSSYSTPSFSVANNWITDNSIGLSVLAGKSIVKNTNFNSSNYAFIMTSNQVTTYIPSSLRIAEDFSGTLCNYWCSSTFTTSITKSVSKTQTSIHVGNNNYNPYYYATGSGTCVFGNGGEYVNTSGNITNTNSRISIKGSITHNDNSRIWLSGPDKGQNAHPQCTYAITSGSSFTAYYRPAMVIDISKF